MDTMQQTTAPLTRRQAREIERRTGVRPVATATAFARPGFQPEDAFRHETGEIARNAVASLKSVVPTEVFDRETMLSALRAPAADAAAAPERMTVRAAKPAAIIAKDRRRTAVAGFAVAASALAAVAAIAPIAQDGQAADQAHAADLAAAQADSVSAAAKGDAVEHAEAPVADRVITDVVEAPAAVIDRASTVDGSAEAGAEEAPSASTLTDSSSSAAISTGTSTDASTATAGQTSYSAVTPFPGGYINEGFGTRGGAHMGVDMVNGGGTCGADLVAAESGTVTTAGVYNGYGNAVIITLDSGDELLYGHLQGFAVSAGERVSAGQTIGYAGNTGNSYGCHLHFEVHQGGSAIDPEPWLAARGI